MTPSTRPLEAKEMRQLRRPGCIKRLAQYREEILSHHWFHGNFSAFANAGASSVELAAEKLEQALFGEDA